MNEIYYLTTNKGKIASANREFKDSNIKIVGYELEVQEPYIQDIDKIAEFKVKTAYDLLKKPCIANDSGFYIVGWPKCKDWPGALVHRELIDKVGLDGLLQEMENVADRSCYFKQSLAFYDGKTFKIFHGISNGVLAKTRFNDYKNNSRWSELWEVFIPEGYDVTLSQFTDDMLVERSKKFASKEVLKAFKDWIENEYNK